MTRVRAFLIRGLFGAIFSTGMDALAEELNQIKGCSATPEGNSFFPLAVIGDLTQAALKASLNSGRKIVLVGHSYGAYAASSIAAGLALHKVKTSLLVLDDTTRDAPLVPETGGVRLQYYQTRELMGGGRPDSVPNATTPLERIELPLGHIQMDDAPTVHQRVIAEVKKILAA